MADEVPGLAVFQHDNLPGHPANVHIEHPLHEVDWPEFGGVPAMPMSGRFLVRGADGVLAECQDGFLTVGPDGHPRWSPGPPG